MPLPQQLEGCRRLKKNQNNTSSLKSAKSGWALRRRSCLVWAVQYFISNSLSFHFILLLFLACCTSLQRQRSIWRTNRVILSKWKMFVSDGCVKMILHKEIQQLLCWLKLGKKGKHWCSEGVCDVEVPCSAHLCDYFVSNASSCFCPWWLQFICIVFNYPANIKSSYWRLSPELCSKEIQCLPALCGFWSSSVPTGELTPPSSGF